MMEMLQAGFGRESELLPPGAQSSEVIGPFSLGCYMSALWEASGILFTWSKPSGVRGGCGSPQQAGFGPASLVTSWAPTCHW